MADLRVPTGVFLLLELEPLDPAAVGVLAQMFVRMAQVRSVTDLALLPLALLEERVLLRLSPEEQAWFRKHSRKKGQPTLL